MIRIRGLCLVLAIAAAPAFAQQPEDHSQHHPGGTGQAPLPKSNGPASPQPSPGPASSASPAGAEGMMQMMMRNMPDQCRAAMQNMPPSCMAMMKKMMSGMAHGDRTQSGGVRAAQQGIGSNSGAASGSEPGTHSDHAAHGGGGGSAASSAPHISAFNEAVEKMHEPMMVGVRHENPDVAFARGMVPHHQAAIDMALVVLNYGKDEKMRKLALDVIREQNREIAEMNEWLRVNSR